MYGHGWGMGFGWVFMSAFWVLTVLGIVALVRWMGSQSSVNREPRPRTALEILQERYARGEIQREEYEQKKRDLTA